MTLRTPERPYAMSKLTNTQIKTALAETGGVMATAARRLGVSRDTLYRRVNATPELAEARALARDLFLDEAETALLDLVRAGNLPAVLFVLRVLGRHRGWTEQPESEGRGRVTIRLAEVPQWELIDSEGNAIP